MLRSHIDHLVVTTPSLTTGVEHVQHVLGVTLQRGGEHMRMSTHNALLRLGPALYLEVIAINPQAAKPERARWFELDRMPTRARPRLLTWVARTNDIRAAVTASPIALGTIEAMRRGTLNWLITIPDDGSLPCDGIAPTLIEWHTGVHPATMLQDAGCSLARLECLHPQAEKIADMLRAIGFEDEGLLPPPRTAAASLLVAHIRTPAGMRVL